MANLAGREVGSRKSGIEGGEGGGIVLEAGSSFSPYLG